MYLETQSLLGSLSESLKSLITDKKFEEAFDKTASVAEEEAVIKLFLINLETGDLSVEGINLSGSNILVRIFSELGLRENDNPFITFYKKYKKRYKVVNLSDDNYITLNNLYAKGVVDFNDIAGTNKEGTKSIYYNENFYLLSRDDAVFIANAYDWLGDEYNINRMNMYAVLKDKKVLLKIRKNIASIVDIDETSGTAKLKSDTKIQDVRNAIIYSSASQPGGRLNSKVDIETTLTSASRKDIGSTADVKETSVKKVLNDIQKLSAKEREELITALKKETEK